MYLAGGDGRWALGIFGDCGVRGSVLTFRPILRGCENFDFTAFASTLSFFHSPILRYAAMESASHKYPGVNLPLRHLAQCGKPGTDFYRLGSFEGAADSMSELLQVREVAIMILMDRLTDSPDWHEKMFDDAIVADWRSEALTQQAEEAVYEQVVSDKTIPMPCLLYTSPSPRDS